MKHYLSTKMSLLLLCLIAAMGSKAAETTLASWAFDKAYDTTVSEGVTYYTPNSDASVDVTGWFNSITPCFRPTTSIGNATDYALTTKSGRYFQLCTGYNNRVLRMDNSDGANNISDFTDGSQHNAYYEISFPTTSYKDVKVTYNCAFGGNAEAQLVAMVSTDNGATWVNAGTNACSPYWWIYTTRTVNISAQNKDKVIVRLVAGNGYASNWNLQDIKVTGTYSTEFKQQYALSAVTNIAGAGVITTTPSGTELDEGTEVSLTATPNFGYRFVNWTDCNNDDAELTTAKTAHITMDKAQSLKANFEAVATYELTYSIEGVNGNHLVSVAPAPTVIGGKNMYEEGTDVTLTASDNEVISFLYWNNGASSNKSYTIKMNQNQNAVATYTGKNYIVGWDLFSETPKNDRAADFAADDSNKGKMYLTNGTSNKSWLSHTGWVGHHCAISWQNIAEKYYFQWEFSTLGKKNISFKLTAGAINYSRYTSYDLQYSTDNATWTTVENFDFSTNTAWTTKNVTLPEAADKQEMVYVRIKPADDATVAGSGNDCLSVTDIFVTFDNGADADDTTAPTLESTLPTANATDIATSGSVILSFNEDIALAEGAYGMLDGEKIVPTITGSKAIFAYSALNFSSDYTFTLAANSITDIAGNKYDQAISIAFTTAARQQPSAKLYDAIVAKDGTGDFSTIQAAVNAAPANLSKPYLIFVKAGQYEEHVDIPASKPYLHFIGEGRNLVSIEDKKLEGGLGKIVPTHPYELQPNGEPFSVYDGATVVCQANNVYFEGINFVNTYGRDQNDGPQALALFANADRFILNKCGLISFQDTYLTAWNSQAYRQYVKNSWIEGAVDFIYGGGDIYFDQDTINIVRKDGGYIVAPSHTEESKWGYVFDHNVITSTIVDDPTQTTCYFGRPWTAQPKTVFLHTQCEISTYPGIWYDHMGGLPTIWAVYDMWDKNGNPMSTESISQYYVEDKTTKEKTYATAKNSLTDDEAAAYTKKNILRGNDAWQPELICEATDKPAIVANGNNITWDAVDYAICYAILKNGKVADFTTSTSYEVSDNAMYSVKSVNENGGLSEASNAIAIVTLGANGYSTYASQVSFTFSGAKAYKAAVEGESVVLTEVEGTIPAETGIVFKGEEGDVVTIVPSTSSATLTGNALVGVTANTTAFATGKNFVLSSNGTETAFVNMSTDKTVQDMMGKAYLNVASTTDAKSVLYIEFADATSVSIAEAATDDYKVRKNFKNGAIIIETANGTFNAMGAQVK